MYLYESLFKHNVSYKYNKIYNLYWPINNNITLNSLVNLITKNNKILKRCII